jgi:integrase/DNA-binding CsgD family transcriptional regulator
MPDKDTLPPKDPWPDEDEDGLTLDDRLAEWDECAKMDAEIETARRRSPGGPDWTPPRRETLTDASVDRLKPKRKRYAKSDPDCRGHWIRVEPSGSKSCYAMAYDPNGKQIWARLGPFNAIEGGLKGAREKARKAIARIKAGLSPSEAPSAQGQTFRQAGELWMKLYVEKKELISKPKKERMLEKVFYPRWENRAFESIRKSDVNALADEVQLKRGDTAADRVILMFNTIARWYAGRTDDYAAPICERRIDPKEHERDRILNNEEIRALWAATENGVGSSISPTGYYTKGYNPTSSAFNAFVRTLLLTTQRDGTVVKMKREDIDADGVWTVPVDSKRRKKTIGKVQLPGMVRREIGNLPIFEGNPYVFAGCGQGHINGLGLGKKRLDERMKDLLGGELEPWVLHDLRRTARSLMSRAEAGIPREYAERALGHTIRGVEGTYDRHDYFGEKTETLRKLAVLMEQILHGGDNADPLAAPVVPVAPPEPVAPPVALGTPSKPSDNKVVYLKDARADLPKPKIAQPPAPVVEAASSTPAPPHPRGNGQSASPDQKVQILKLQESGKSQQAIATELGLSRKAVRTVINRKRLGLPPTQPRPAATVEQKAQILKLRKSGKGERAIATELGLGRKVVRTVIKKAAGTDRASMKQIASR